MSAKILQFPKPEVPDHDPQLTKARAAMRELQAQADRQAVAQVVKTLGLGWSQSQIVQFAKEIREHLDKAPSRREG